MTGLDPVISIECLLTGITSFVSFVRVAVAGTSPAMTALESQSFRRSVAVIFRHALVAPRVTALSFSSLI